MILKAILRHRCHLDHARDRSRIALAELNQSRKKIAEVFRSEFKIFRDQLGKSLGRLRIEVLDCEFVINS